MQSSALHRTAGMCPESPFLSGFCPSAFTSSPSLSQSTRAGMGQQGQLWGETTVPRDTMGRWEFLDKVSLSSCQRQLLSSHPSHWKAASTPAACSPRRKNYSQGHSPGHILGHSLELQMFHVLQTGLSSCVWLCSTWGRSYCPGSGAEWRFTGHRCTYKAVFHPKCFYDSISAPELSFDKKEVQHYKGERFPLLPAHTTPQTPQTPTGQEPAQASNSSYTHPPSSAQHSQPSWPPAREHN